MLRSPICVTRPPFSTIESDEVPDPVRCVREDEYTGEEVGDRVLGAEADRDPDDSQRRR